MPEYHPFLEVDIGYAMMTSGGFSSLTYRSGFDVSVPVYSPLAAELRTQSSQDRSWLVISSQPYIREVISEMAAEHPGFLVLNSCGSSPLDTKLRCRDEETYNFPDVLMVYLKNFQYSYISFKH
jgi:glucuronyl/N-acetylglucosaminyl transferase EXT2